MVTLNVLYALSLFSIFNRLHRVRSFLMNAVFASFSIVAKYVFIMSSDGCLIAFECHFCIFGFPLALMMMLLLLLLFFFKKKIFFPCSAVPSFFSLLFASKFLQKCFALPRVFSSCAPAKWT